MNVLVLSDSLVQFDPAAVKLEHGRVNVVTTRGLAVRVGVLKVVPVSDSTSTELKWWTPTARPRSLPAKAI